MRTVEAMDWRSLRAAVNESFFSASWRWRFFRITNHQTKNTTRPIAATPPMTPPTMAPVLLPPESDGWEPPVEMHFVVAHSSQVCVFMVHVEPSGQAGHAGAEVSHCLQRLKRERAGEKSESMGSRSMMKDKSHQSRSTAGNV